MKQLLSVVLIGMLILSSSLVFADGVNQRQKNQKNRIGQGVRSGQLTAKETHRLLKQQSKINRTERRFRADGNFTRAERARTHRLQNKASKSIFKQKHDRQTR